MSKPNNPYEVIVRNRFFPRGLNEENIYLYWMRNKVEILTYLRGKDVMFYLGGSGGQLVVRRYQRPKIRYRLTDENYSELVGGRTLGILEVFGSSSSVGVVDIDSPSPSDDDLGGISSDVSFAQTKEVAAEAYDFFGRLYDCELLFTGKNGFHIRTHLSASLRMDRLKEILRKQIEGSPIAKYLTKRNSSSPNVDLSPNMLSGATIIPGSLNKIGLPAAVIPRNKLLEFSRESLVSNVLPKGVSAVDTSSERNPNRKPPTNPEEVGLSLQGSSRSHIRIGSVVLVAEKINYSNGKLTKGTVSQILTNKPNHPRGIKVRLEDGTVGRVQKILKY